MMEANGMYNSIHVQKLSAQELFSQDYGGRGMCDMRSSWNEFYYPTRFARAWPPLHVPTWLQTPLLYLASCSSVRMICMRMHREMILYWWIASTGILPICVASTLAHGDLKARADCPWHCICFLVQ